MSKQPAPIVVTIKEGRHATQPWTFTVNRPGPQSKETKSERYARLFTAKRGALRVIDAWKTYIDRGWGYEAKHNGKFVPVTFYIIRRKTTKAK
jgi:DNA polymerase IIIc chi subunit